jgi:uncharacterized membrane protein
MKVSTFPTFLLISSASAWTPRVPDNSLKVPSSFVSKQPAVSSFDPLDLGEQPSNLPSTLNDSSDLKAFFLSSVALGTPTIASATTAFAPNAIPSAIAAYGHYLSLLGILACIMIERLTIKPNMTEKEEDLVALADIGLGLWGVLIAYTGYLRATVTEKGFDFYSHEPIFWLKICFVGIFGAGTITRNYISYLKIICLRLDSNSLLFNTTQLLFSILPKLSRGQ